MLTFGSLFTGIGGFDIAFQRAGMRCAWMAEIDKNCRTVLDHHWPKVRKHGDVREIGSANLGPVDLICGGFPCQNVSVAGRREGLDGEQSGLWFEFLRIIAELKPRWVVVENVPGLLSSNGKRDFATILRGLGECGYGWAYRILDAQYFGVAQRRRRVFVVGCLGDWRSAAQVLFERESSAWDSAPCRETGKGTAATVIKGAAIGRKPEAGPQRGEILEDGTCYTLNATEVHAVANSIVSHHQHLDPTQETFVAIRNSGRDADMRPGRQGTTTQEDVMFALQAEQSHAVVAFQQDATDKFAEGIAPTMRGKSNGGTRAYGVAGSFGVRRLTPLECERLQGFPDGFTDADGMSDSARYRMLGNAVAVPVVEWLGHRIMEANLSPGSQNP